MIHITLNTGHSCVSPRGEVDQRVIRALSGLVSAGGGPIPGLSPWRVTIHQHPGGWSFDLARGQEVALFCVLAHDPEHGRDLWEGIERVYFTIAEQVPQMLVPGVNAAPEMPSSTPWLAVLILPSGLLATAASDISWFGDFERCLAWTLLEKTGIKS